MKTLKDKVAVVTGASRGVGRGIALGLGEAGAIVYVRGRSVTEGQNQEKLSGTISQTAYDVTAQGGSGIAVRCDHRHNDNVDMAHELLPYGVAALSLYPGLVRTQRVMANAEHFDLSNSESPQFIGRAVAALAADPAVMEKSGRVLVAASLALEYGFADIDGKQPRPLTLAEA